MRHAGAIMIRKLFPSFLYEATLRNSNLKSFNSDLAEEAYRIRDTDDNGRAWSAKNYPDGYTSYGSMDALHRFSSTFEALEKAIDRHVTEYVRSLEMEIKPSALKMTSCWVNIMSQNVTHSGHIHPLSVVSGTYYVTTPPKGGSLKFEDPRLGFFMASPPRKMNAKIDNRRFFEIHPKAGQVVLFESWMRHEVPPNQDKRDRISVSFNYDWVGR